MERLAGSGQSASGRLAAKAAVNIFTGSHGVCTALQEAAKGGHIKVVEALLAAKADVNVAAARRSGRTAVQAAAEGGRIRTLVDLIVVLHGLRADVQRVPHDRDHAEGTHLHQRHRMRDGQP